eukprot:758095-Hanusia_phi.AAC.1
MSDDDAVESSRGMKVKAIRDELEKRSRESGGNFPSPLPFLSNSGSFLRRSMSEERPKGENENFEPSQRNLFDKEVTDVRKSSDGGEAYSEHQYYKELELRNDRLNKEKQELQMKLADLQHQMEHNIRNHSDMTYQNGTIEKTDSSLTQLLESKDKEIAELKEMVRHMLNERKLERQYSNQYKDDQIQRNEAVRQIEAERTAKQQLIRQLKEVQGELARIKVDTSMTQTRTPDQASPSSRSGGTVRGQSTFPCKFCSKSQQDFNATTYKAASSQYVKEIHRLETLLHQQSKTILELRSSGEDLCFHTELAANSGRAKDSSMLDILRRRIFLSEPSAAAMRELQTFLQTLQDPQASPPSAAHGFKGNRGSYREVEVDSRSSSEHAMRWSFTDSPQRQRNVSQSPPSSRTSPQSQHISTGRNASRVYSIAGYGAKAAASPRQRMDFSSHDTARKGYDPYIQQARAGVDEAVYLLSV